MKEAWEKTHSTHLSGIHFLLLSPEESTRTATLMDARVWRNAAWTAGLLELSARSRGSFQDYDEGDDEWRSSFFNYQPKYN